MLHYGAQMIRENLTSIKTRIIKACESCNRDPGEIKLIAVTKQADLDQIRETIDCGVTDIGENRIQDAISKYTSLQRKIRWHMIGHLQTNKVKKAVKIFDLIHSVDSLELAKEISKQASNINKIQEVLIQVNTSQEESKFGIKLKETNSFIEQIISLNNIRVSGLMTMAPLVDDPEEARSCFKKLKTLSKELDFLPTIELSMGMSQDFEVAIQEGATMLRIGSAIFKD